MNRVIFLSVAALAFSGCISMPPEARARAQLSAVSSAKTPIREYVTVDGQEIILSRFGYAFPDAELVTHIADLVSTRLRTAVWPRVEQVAGKDSIWTVQGVGSFISISFSSGAKPGIERFFVAPNGRIGLERVYEPLLNKMEPIMISLERDASGSGGRAPLVFIK